MSRDAMRKIGRIILAWWYWVSNRNNELAAERLKTCSICPKRIWFVCGECGCALQAKARDKNEKCPHPWGDLWADHIIIKINTPGDEI